MDCGFWPGMDHLSGESIDRITFPVGFHWNYWIVRTMGLFFLINSGFEIVGSFFELKESGKMVFFLSFSQPLSMFIMELVLNYEKYCGFFMVTNYSWIVCFLVWYDADFMLGMFFFAEWIIWVGNFGLEVWNWIEMGLFWAHLDLHRLGVGYLVYM